MTKKAIMSLLGVITICLTVMLTTTYLIPKAKSNLSKNPVFIMVKKLNTDAKTSKQAFLKNFINQAESKADTWFTNQQKLGYDEINISLQNPEQLESKKDKQQNTTFILRIGTHNKLDPYQKQNNITANYLTAADYKITMQKTKTNEIITQWEGLTNAPWDETNLYVKKGTESILAGSENDKSIIDSSIKNSDQAAKYTIDFIKNTKDTKVLNNQQGFITFIGNAKNNWFLKPVAKSTTKNTRLAGEAILLNQEAQFTTSKNPAFYTPATSRNVIQTNNTIMERDFIYLNVQNVLQSNEKTTTAPVANLNYASGTTLNTWSKTSIANFVLENYASGTTTSSTIYDYHTIHNIISEGLKKHLSVKIPTDGDITENTASFYQALGVSIYGFIIDQYYPQASNDIFNIAVLSLVKNNTPFDNILKSKNPAVSFYDKILIEKQWTAWIKAKYSNDI